MKNYPKKIYVQVFKDGNEEYLNAHQKVDETEDGVVAVYDLVKVLKKRTQTILEEKK